MGVQDESAAVAVGLASGLVEQLATLVTEARQTDDLVQVCGLIAEIQRASGWALRAAVGEASDQGVSWRELGRRVGISFGSLHRQYQAGGPLRIVRPGADADVPRSPASAGSEVPTADPERMPGIEPVGRSWPISQQGAGGPAGESPDQAGGSGESAGGAPSVDDSAPLAPGWLPAPVDSFVGREQELAEVARLLGRTRLLSVVGAAGSGKTRLAVEAATRARRSFRDGVWLVELASVSSPDMLPQTIATVLGVQERPGEDLVDTVAAALGGRRALLVVDNCEHLVEGCAGLVEALLRRCARLRVLVTSREALQVAGEVMIGLGPLPLPPAQGPLEPAVLVHSDAVRLFVERARASMPGFELTTETGPVIAAICVRLDGLPLAIELATRRLRTLPPDRLLAHLKNRFDLLISPRRQAPGRQRSLRAAIEWSYDLLGGHERALFRRLAALPGGFSLTSATAVCADAGGGRADALDATGVLKEFASLEAKSLLLPTGPGRFRQLESIRLFAGEQLAAAGDQETTHDRLLTWLSGLAEPLATEPVASDELDRRLGAEQDNLLYATEWAIDHHDHRQVLLGAALAQIWRALGYVAEGQRLLDRVLDHDRAPAVHRGFAYQIAAILALWQGDYGRGLPLAEEAVRIMRGRDEVTVLAHALGAAGRCHMGLDKPDRALRCFVERVELLRSLGDPLVTACAEQGLAWDALQADELDQAARLVAGALPVIRARGDEGRKSAALHTAGALALVQGDLDRAKRHFDEALTLSDADLDSMAYNIQGLAIVSARRGEAERALRLAGGASAIRDRLHMLSERWWRGLVSDAIEEARRRLPAAKAEAALNAGRRLQPQQAVGYALDPRWTDRGGADPVRALLTTREQQVVALLARGLTNDQIGRQLGMAHRTVCSHLEHIRTKLDLPSRAQIAIWAVAHSLTGPQEDRSSRP